MLKFGLRLLRLLLRLQLNLERRRAASPHAAVVLSVKNINQHQLKHSPHRPDTRPPPEPHLHPAHTAPPPPLYEQACRGGSRLSVPAQERGASPPHPRPYAAQAGTIRRDRRSRGRKKCRCSTNAGRRSPADRRQRSGIQAKKRVGPGGEVVNQSNLQQTRHTPSSSKRRKVFSSQPAAGSPALPATPLRRQQARRNT